MSRIPTTRPDDSKRPVDHGRTAPRRNLALTIAALLFAVPSLASCGFNYATDREYSPAAGSNNQDGVVDVLNAVIVSQEDGSGTFITSLSNGDPADDDLLHLAGLRLQLHDRGGRLRPDRGRAPAAGQPRRRSGDQGRGRLHEGRLPGPDGRLRQRRDRRRQRARGRRGLRVGGPGQRHGHADRALRAPLPFVDDLQAGPAPPRRERVERQEPVHRLGRRPAQREGRGRGRPRRRAARATPACCPTSCTPRCCGARSAPPASPSTPPTGTGSPSAARGASTSGTTARSRARTRSRRSRSTARSSSCSGAARSTCRRRRSRTTTSSPRPGDPRYADLGDEMPRTECLKDVIARMLPYWDADIIADLRAGRRVLVAAHGNSLRALVKHLDEISDEDIAGLNIPTGMPLLYRARRGPAADRPGRRVPRPRRRRRGGRRRRQPGPLTRRDPRLTGILNVSAAAMPASSGTALPVRDVRDGVAQALMTGNCPVTTKMIRLPTDTAWSAIRS